MLRSYKFDGPKFESRLYHYEDPDCSRPLYGIVATGRHHLIQVRTTLCNQISLTVCYTKLVSCISAFMT